MINNVAQTLRSSIRHTRIHASRLWMNPWETEQDEIGLEVVPNNNETRHHIDHISIQTENLVHL